MSEASRSRTASTERSVSGGGAAGAPPLREVVAAMRCSLAPADRWYHLRRYKAVLVGSDVAGWIAAQAWCRGRAMAVAGARAGRV